MQIIQRIEIVSEVTEEELRGVDLNEYEQELLEQIKSETDENAKIKVEIIIEK